MEQTKRTELKVKLCPNCGKIELYIDPNDINM